MLTDSFKSDLGKYKPLKKGKNFPITLSEETENNSDCDVSWANESERKFSYNPSYELNVYDVASYILKKCGELTTMKLHKLVYYSQAWSLVWDEKPLFNERIEAWANGPVIKELFSYHKGCYSISNISIGNYELLNDIQKETIDSVIDYYGGKSAQWLIELSHLEEPWKKARIGLSPNERGNTVITNESMAEYYSSL